MGEAVNLSYLELLNAGQRQAVLHTGKPLLILAGAGSGKTRVITTKIAWLIREQEMDPRSILAVTFTNKAAREMAERAGQIEKRAGDAMLRTFHSFGAWFLRRNGGLAGLDSSFTIYDDDDVVSLLSSILENTPKTEAKHYARNISRAKDYFLCPDDPKLTIIDHNKKFRSIYKRYEERMSQIGNVDFGDLIKKPVEILRSQPEVARRFHDRFKVIMVDEYQDANVAQFQFLKELCGPDTYVCVVGDDDQSIYRFRGAEVKNILEFPKRFSGADIIRLEQNYRSTSPILKAASSVVDNNKGRLGKILHAEKGDGPLPELVCLSDDKAEASFCANKITTSVKMKETTWSDWAILYRINAQSAGFETAFLRMNIPYRVVGSLRFYEREEVKDALALLAFLVNPRDEVAFRRVVNKPPRGVGAVTIDKIIDTSGKNDGDLLETSRKLDCPKKARNGLDEFIKVIEDADECLHKTSSKIKKLSVCVEKMLINSGITEYYETQDEIAGNSKLGNLHQLLNIAGEYPNNREGLLKFLEDIELNISMEDNSGSKGNPKNAVTLITFHNTKGLEFKRVIMTGLEQGIFPRDDKKGDELEEERRLFYVGATRAMDVLYLTTCEERQLYGRTEWAEPSIFLDEIDKSCLQINELTNAQINKLLKNTAAIKSNTAIKNTAKTKGQYANRGSFTRKTFNPLNPQDLHASATAKKGITAKQSGAANTELEERAGWRRGQRLFHDDHGYGAVINVKDSDDGPVVHVRFDSGNESRFLSKYQGRDYEKISDDY
jgi:DNA helicase-2/ATP-dependent DNA helicase PcrA